MSDVITRNSVNYLKKPQKTNVSMHVLDSTVATMCESPTSSNSSMALPANGSDGIETKVPKVCAVCGDKALGYNFGAMTCESCKAFFRRNALSRKELKCPFENTCEVTQVTRRFCQRCRLQKCGDIGMKKEYILTQEQKDDKRRKIEENRQKKQHQIKRKPSLDIEMYEAEQITQKLTHKKLQFPVTQSPDSSFYQSLDGPTSEKIYRMDPTSVVVPNPAQDVGIDRESPSKSQYAFDQPQKHVKIEQVQSDYQTHFNNIPPMLFVPTTNSNIASEVGTNSNVTTPPNSSSPIQHQNVGTILAENNAMLQNTPIAT